MIDFYIEKINFEFEKHGDCELEFYWNDYKVQKNIIWGHDIKNNNKLEIFFKKKDPADSNSFAKIKHFKINNGDFTDWFSKFDYIIDQSKHKDTEKSITNNGYFGYVGHMSIDIEQCKQPLQKAAWLIADRNFKSLKVRSRENFYREKTFETVHDDAKWMFTGSWPPNTKEIVESIDKLTIKDAKQPVIFEDLRKETEQWLLKSNRVTFRNFDKFEHFTFEKGILTFINSFILRHKEIYKPEKIYQFIGEISEDKNIRYQDIFGEIKQNSVLYLELPSPWYTNERLMQIVKEARNKNCYIVVDLIWCPIATNKIDIDLDLFDEVLFSMNKAWPINHLRPAIRWSKNNINDISSYTNKWGYHPKVEANVFLDCIRKFSYDYTFNKYEKDAEEIRDTFSLQPTEVLWFTKHDSYKHNTNNYWRTNS